jgi:hypothetical protein
MFSSLLSGEATEDEEWCFTVECPWCHPPYSTWSANLKVNGGVSTVRRHLGKYPAIPNPLFSNVPLKDGWSFTR